MSKYDDLVKKLKEIFQIDRPELDFGIYRIFNTRAAEINHYLEHRLKAKVNESLAASGAANLDGLQRELAEKETQYRADGIDPATVPKVQEIKQKLAQYSTGASEHENAVFSHLLTFFSRYYDKGDFISQRRYKGDTYAIPYAGEEVVLHWANKDQYYIKSSESFSNYAFKLDDGRTVCFRLVTADTARDNRKDNDKERRFVLIEKHTRILADEEGDEIEEELFPVTEENGANGQELVLRFEYKAMPKNTPDSKQEKLVADAVNAILNDANVKARWLGLSQREPTEKNPHRTLLEKHLTQYTTRNTADYFIHKDLGRFLRNELDFYIKNEVMHLDDVQHAEKFADIERNLRLIQTLRAIALDLIAFLAQLEDFQKKLWLKKKFVVATHYCITLDRVPETLYPIIAANPRQWEQWKKLGMLSENKTGLFSQAKAGSIEYLKAHPYPMADTTLYADEFKQWLLAAIDNLDDSLDGLLIHGDNFQALNLINERYTGMVDCIYIDPPYNTSASEIIYKNSYKDSSWLTLITDRLNTSTRLLNQDASIAIAIDDFAMVRLSEMTDNVLSSHERNMVIVNHHPQGSGGNNISRTHEYMLVYTPIGKDVLRGKEKSGETEYRSFMLSGPGDNKSRNGRPNSFYAFILDKKNKTIIGIEPPPKKGEQYTTEDTAEGYSRVYPIGQSGREQVWCRSYTSAVQALANGEIILSENLILKLKVDTKGKRSILMSNWVDSRFNAGPHGTRLIADILGSNEAFSYPKSIHTVTDAIDSMTHSIESPIIIDYFAGSGTTGHAVINLNRQDNGNRKYILVEQGEYFDTVLKPRIQKVVYSADWKDGKATAPETGISHAFKVLKLESYEDTLNNLQLRRTAQQQDLLDTLPQSAREDYLLRYMLDIESRDSLLSVEQFYKPFDCALKVTVDSAGAYGERTIDLVETFNYLIGLRVRHIDMQLEQGFVTVTGWLPTGEKTLVLWRDVERVNYEALNRLCEKLAINPADSEFEVVYINGDHNIPAVFTTTEAEGGITKTLKIRQIEPEFLQRMFSMEV
ncbi:site-specific DNA-methyltransferase [Nitrosomonas sp.]|uniref:site-specific DNA-methyltransferase n=1 Tax=Nitrosomonas sp. TaxID=42353 RepID=UPI00272F0287|nr:site-specific DNA-methyltransferase [Nitrosomonas sp.]MDP1786788.1 site-specific DNA-methyltransferase [Nitrosomonas sp.]